jgi:hypothetical protein
MSDSSTSWRRSLRSESDLLLHDSTFLDASVTQQSHYTPTQPSSNPHSQTRQAGKRKLTHTPAEVGSLATESTVTQSDSINNPSSGNFGKSHPNTIAARLTEFTLPNWPYGKSEVAAQLGFALDEGGFKDRSIWTQSCIVAPHYQQLRELFNQGLLNGANPRPLFPTLTRMALKDERYVKQVLAKCQADNRIDGSMK